MAKQLAFTEDGRNKVNDYHGTKRVIIYTIRERGACNITELISRIRANHIEYKHMQIHIFMNHIGELIHEGTLCYE